jgi:hypothetical protein
MSTSEVTEGTDQDARVSRNSSPPRCAQRSDHFANQVESDGGLGARAPRATLQDMCGSIERNPEGTNP